MTEDYKLYREARRYKNEIVYETPAIYHKDNTDYQTKLSAKKKKAEDFMQKCIKEKKLFFWVFFLIFTAAIFIAAAIIMLIMNIDLKRLWIAAIISLVVGLAAGFFVSRERNKKNLLRARRMGDDYKSERLAQKANEHLFNTFRFAQIENVIMGGGILTVSYVDEEGHPKTDTYKYEEWSDESMKAPFLIFDGNKLYGRSAKESPRTYFTTSMIGYDEE